MMPHLRIRQKFNALIQRQDIAFFYHLTDSIYLHLIAIFIPVIFVNTRSKPLKNLTITKTVQQIIFSTIIALTLLTTGCASIGKDFPVAEVASIEIGKTTQKQISEMFGSPWRTGLESGQKTWTYGSYSYGIFQEKNAKDLVIRFDEKNTVASYTFSTTEHEE